MMSRFAYVTFVPARGASGISSTVGAQQNVPVVYKGILLPVNLGRDHYCVLYACFGLSFERTSVGQRRSGCAIGARREALLCHRYAADHGEPLQKRRGGTLSAAPERPGACPRCPTPSSSSERRVTARGVGPASAVAGSIEGPRVRRPNRSPSQRSVASGKTASIRSPDNVS